MTTALVTIKVRIPDGLTDQEKQEYLDEINVEVTDENGGDIYLYIEDYA